MSNPFRPVKLGLKMEYIEDQSIKKVAQRLNISLYMWEGITEEMERTSGLIIGVGLAGEDDP